jgi:FixJ family two-component response regulator
MSKEIAAAGSTMPELPRPVIFVIDDDAAVRRSLKFALEQEGLEVHLYDSGEHLLGERDLPQSGCLVVDYVMPGMDGITLVERLRQRHVYLPAILITAKDSPKVLERALRSGFQQVLEKPLEDSSLLDSIRVALAASA